MKVSTQTLWGEIMSTVRVIDYYNIIYYLFIMTFNGATGVVVLCKIPILVSRVRFPGGALFE